MDDVSIFDYVTSQDVAIRITKGLWHSSLISCYNTNMTNKTPPANIALMMRMALLFVVWIGLLTCSILFVRLRHWSGDEDNLNPTYFIFSLLSCIGLGIIAATGSLLSLYNLLQATRKSHEYLIRTTICLLLFLVPLGIGVLINI